MYKAILACGLAIAALAIPASADTPASQLQYFIGTWNCIVHAGQITFTVNESIAVMPGGAWLHETATDSEKNQPVATEDNYLGYDTRNSRYVLLGITSLGTYYVSTSSSTTLNGSKWQSAFPTGTSDTLTEDSSTRYTIDGVDAGGATTQQVCTRQ